MKDGYLYAAGRRLITQDINAAVRGAFDGGADEVIVFVGHGGRVNVLVEDLDPRVLVIAGAAHKPRFPMLDRSVDGMFLLGYHAMAGAERATLEHTMNSKRWHCFKVNGKPYGELGIDAELAAEAGVPVIMVPDADAAETYDSKRVDGYTVEKTYDHLSEMYGGNWADYGIEQVVF